MPGPLVQQQQGGSQHGIGPVPGLLLQGWQLGLHGVPGAHGSHMVAVFLYGTDGSLERLSPGGPVGMIVYPCDGGCASQVTQKLCQTVSME
jgi:hypothetical protein